MHTPGMYMHMWAQIRACMHTNAGMHSGSQKNCSAPCAQTHAHTLAGPAGHGATLEQRPSDQGESRLKKPGALDEAGALAVAQGSPFAEQLGG